MANETISTRCCIAGGGPAGMMLGFLLARSGVDVIVLEKHGDFLRDFRGDTIHPSTLDIMYELGLLDGLLQLPHQKAEVLKGQVADVKLPVADFTRLPAHCRFIAFMPQWDFLNFLAKNAAQYPSFHLRMRNEVTDLLQESGRVIGVQVQTPDGPVQILTDLVVGADGRSSIVREKAGLEINDLGAPMDALWFRISRVPSDPDETLLRFDTGQLLVMINRGEHWQFGLVVKKGSIDSIHAQGLAAFRERIGKLAPFARDRIGEIDDWEKVKLLTVKVDRLEKWYKPGLLCIGDAAHAMSPIGGVGINLAIQDAVAAANILARPIRDGSVGHDVLKKVQERRELPARWIQNAQVLIQNRVLAPLLENQGPPSIPLPFRIISRFRPLRQFLGSLVGMGIRPEHPAPPLH